MQENESIYEDLKIRWNDTLGLLSLTYTNVAMTDGSPLPPWLIYDPIGHIISATGSATVPGTYYFMMNCSDELSTTHERFSIRINNAQELSKKIDDIKFSSLRIVNFTIPDTTFSDKDGEDLIISVDPTS